MVDNETFAWTGFYEEFANKLLRYKEDRSPLVAGLHEIAKQHSNLPTKLNHKGDPLQDICPFTTIGIFNRGISDANRRALAKVLGEFLNVKTQPPHSLAGIPTLSALKSWFHGPWEPGNDEIEKLWQVFDDAIKFAESNESDDRLSFIKSYNNALSINGVSYSLSMGLYWIRPYCFLALDKIARSYLKDVVHIPPSRLNKTPNGENYLVLRDELKEWLNRDDSPVHSFPELSHVAFVGPPPPPPPPPLPPTPEDPLSKENVDKLSKELMWEPVLLRGVVDGLKDKGQVIFQGPPGTGKTFVAKRLGEWAKEHGGDYKIVQFHPSYSYEDFVEGYRPKPINGNQVGFELRDGPLKEIAKNAENKPNNTFILVIDEINRTNVSKVLGELYFLLEYREDKAPLLYSKKDFNLPKNLWIIGTMNTTDRSIALVDAALRRRFYFYDFFPNQPPIEGLLRRWLEENDEKNVWVADLVDRANKELEDRHLSIGPSHFMKKGQKLDDEWVQFIWERAVFPYIEEQLFSEQEKLKRFRYDALMRELASKPQVPPEEDSNGEGLIKESGSSGHEGGG